MPLIFNATAEKQVVKAQGNWFTLPPKKIQMFQDNIASFLASERAFHGLVMLPDEFEDPEYKKSPEGSKILKEKEELGISNYIEHLRWIVHNNQVSLRQDLEQANIKADPAVFASDGEIDAMKTIAKYQRQESDKHQAKIDEVKEIMKDIKV